MTHFKVMSATGEVLYEADRTVLAQGQLTVNHVIGSSYIAVGPNISDVIVTLPPTEEDAEVVPEADPEADTESEQANVIKASDDDDDKLVPAGKGKKAEPVKY